MEVETSGMCTDKIKGRVWQLIQTEAYRFNKTIATATIRCIVIVAIDVYESSKPVVYRMLTYMCNADGEFLEVYQEEFNQIYDRIETIIQADI